MQWGEENVEIQRNLASNISENNRIVVVAPKVVDVTIYNISGVIIDNRVVEGRVEIEKTSGIYILKVGDKVYKVKI